jgi:hypothetical protein
MVQRLRSAIGICVLGAGAVVWIAASAGAAPLDANGDLTLGARTYTAARVGTQNTDISITETGNDVGTPPQPQQSYRSLTFPVSAAGHLRQSRFFAEVELRHKLDRLIHDGFGPLGLLDDLPFTLRNVGYTVIYRGEYEGVYDYGPGEYSNADQYRNLKLIPPLSGKQIAGCPVGQICAIDPLVARSNLRTIGSVRNRLFQAYVQADAGPIFLRFGRQILAWGETDVFRLLDNINPVDNSFGGFLIPLDERRVPLDMLRASYKVPDFSGIPFHEMYIEGFAAVDNAVGFDPGIPNGSPWQLPNLLPSSTLYTTRDVPPTNISHTRGGFQFKFNAPVPLIEDATFGIAHYYTYLDVPAVQTFVSPQFPATFIPPGLENERNPVFLAEAKESAPTVQITGATTTFLIPSDVVRHIGFSGEPVIRSELAYFRNEPRFTQSTLDPFVYGRPNPNDVLTPGGLWTGNITCVQFSTDPVTGKRTCIKRAPTGPRTGDSWNFVLGMDLNQWIRALNPNQTFFISTQFFYKHLNGAQKRQPIPPVAGFNYLPGQPHVFNGEVLPVPAFDISPDWRGLPNQQAVDAVFVHNPVDQYLQTLLVATSYYSGQVTPAIGVFYDWSGAVVAQPQVTLSRDPFRFTLSYSYLAASSLKGASGISLLHDRDNVLFQFEYVL